MFSLLRLILIIFLIWQIGKYIYSLGQRNAFNKSRTKPNDSDHRKKVDSTVVEKEKDE